jgi:hypothetical protein
MGNIIMKENDHDKLWIDCAVPPRRGRRKQDNDDIAATTTPLDPQAAASCMMKRVPAMSDEQTKSAESAQLGENLLLSRTVWRERTPSITIMLFFLFLGLLDNVSKWNSEMRNIEPTLCICRPVDRILVSLLLDDEGDDDGTQPVSACRTGPSIRFHRPNMRHAKSCVCRSYVTKADAIIVRNEIKYERHPEGGVSSNDN